MAESRLRMLKRKFEANPKLKEDYTKTVEAYISDKQAMLIEDEDVNTAYQWFLPHHAVFQTLKSGKMQGRVRLCRAIQGCVAERCDTAGTKLSQQLVWRVDQISKGASGGDRRHKS